VGLVQNKHWTPNSPLVVVKQTFKVAFSDAIEEFAQAIKIGHWPNAN